MPPTPKPGSLKKVATAAVKKANAKIDSTDYTNYNSKVVKPTADSTAYYANKEYISKLKGLTATTKPEMDKQFALMNKAKIDRYRQSNKGKAGYDKNGFPIKKSKLGGTVKSKKK